MSDELLTAIQVRDAYGISPQTLANHRWRGTGPAYVKISPSKYGRVRYRRSAIEQWLDACTRQVTA
ncbi:helix-turn-helix transcriptional regulator [Streptomyces sp. NPDC058818]|uniref:helix-turn-helix transcriptional regulator n=1 Tax=Streptomyces sp. NPDC058818 TaxID=3346640 RepID=UPI0036C26F9F